MTLTQIAYMILEEIRAGKIVDDERLDIRLIKDWINLKRSQFLKNKMGANSTNRINLNNYQSITVTVAVNANSFLHEYPFDQTADPDRQIIKTVESTTPNPIPNIIENKEGPIIYSLESIDKMKLPFSVVDYDHLRVAGSGKFNRDIIFGSVRDHKIYFKYNAFFDTITTVVLRALFEDPREVPNFNDNTSTYPCSQDVIEYIKNAIFDIDMKVILGTKSDEDNDADGKIQ